MKYQVAHAAGKQIVVEVRSKSGEPLVLEPNTVVDLPPTVAERVMQLYPGRISAVSASAVPTKEQGGEGEGKEEGGEDGTTERKSGHAPGGKPSKVTKEV